MKLIANWRQAWRMHSMRLAALIVVLASLETFLPQLQAYLPPKVYAILGGAVMVARIIQQAKLAVEAANADADKQS